MVGRESHPSGPQTVGDQDCVGVRFSLLDDGRVDDWTKSMQQGSVRIAIEQPNLLFR